MSRFRPTDEKQLAEIVSAALADEEPLEIVAGGSKRGLGRPLQTPHTLDVTGFAGIRQYEPEELVLSAGAATPLDEIERALEAKRQMLAFEPGDWRALLGSTGQSQTLGGAIACNLAGPRRIRQGAARDHFLGFQGVSGRGEAFKAGGRVVKNVTGYDLCKLIAGSYGTLAVMTEITVKVLPLPEATRTVALQGLDDARAVAAMTHGLNSSHELSGAAHLPGASEGALTVLRVEGPVPSVEARSAALREELKTFGNAEILGDAESLKLWIMLRDVASFAEDKQRAVWRVSVAPAAAPALLAQLGRALDFRYFLDWGGGLIWLAVKGGEDGGAKDIRAALAQDRGHATLIRGSAALRASVPVFQPLAPAVAALSARVKDGFDPKRVLNRGRLYPEILISPMQTHFSLAQLADPDLEEANKILRACVHCGFCNATCPTYLLLGDELDGPRGRIYLIKDMLENDKPATSLVAKHIDRCLSCLACMTTCPSGVHYMHLVDQGRRHIEQTYKRPLFSLVLREFLAWMLPYPGRFRRALLVERLARPLAFLLPPKLKAMANLAPRHLPPRGLVDKPRVFPAEGKRVKRVALLDGCVQKVLSPAIDDATMRLLTRHGCEVVVAPGSGCCGSIIHHMGRDALGFARANIDAWTREIETGGLDAIIINASGCGTTVKDYGFLLREDGTYAAKAAKVSALAKDVSEFVATLGLKPAAVATGQRVAYHSACSLQHGQRIHAQPKALLAKAGFRVLDVPEGHICCGSAGTYNMLQPDLANALLDRKIRNIEGLKPEIVAAGNIGCITQIAAGTGLPVVHTVELLDWATGGPRPSALT